MLSEHETMCCAHCGPPRETIVQIDCNGEEMVVTLDAGWCFRFMIIGGPHLRLEVYCPTCAIKEINTPTISNIEFAPPITPQCNCEQNHPKEEHEETCPTKQQNNLCVCGHTSKNHWTYKDSTRCTRLDCNCTEFTASLIKHTLQEHQCDRCDFDECKCPLCKPSLIEHIKTPLMAVSPTHVNQEHGKTVSKEHGRAHSGPMRRPMCICGTIGIRDEKYDAYYCPTNGTWLESKCDDPNCNCMNRPDNAFHVYPD